MWFKITITDFLIFFLLCACGEFNFGRNQEKKSRKIGGSRDIPVLAGALYDGEIVWRKTANPTKTILYIIV